MAVGLEGYGKPTGFYRRQIGSLSKVAAAQAAAKDSEGNAVGPIPGMEEMAVWFKNNEVKDSTSIVHGDYKVIYWKESGLISGEGMKIADRIISIPVATNFSLH